MQKLRNEELNRPDAATFKQSPKIPVVIILDNVRSAQNTGSVFRTSDAFAIESLALCGITATPPNRDVLKTALGATETVEWAHFTSTQEAIAKVRERGYSVYAIEQTVGSIPLDQFSFGSNDKGIALIFGHEMDGVDQQVIDLCDGSIEIPQVGTKHSLNVAVCTGIVAWHFFCHYRS